jgi:glycosyltransferase involved in cell wall biosynthesis
MSGLRTLMPWIDEKVEIIPNMIREDMFLPPPEPRNSEPFVFFWAGRLEHVKGIDLLLSGVAELNQRTGRTFEVRLAGRGSLRHRLEEMAAELGITGQVRFLGRISREEIQQEMQRANCFILLSRYEAFGAVLIEAMATGLPVIATRSGGPEFMVNDQNGILVETENVPQITGAMFRIMEDYGKYDPLKIRSMALERFSEKKVMEMYHRLFMKIVS